ncbi:MAG TPA: Hpt domain-containing protein [Candidatus Limnocylindria bacterium]|nr:Hpt domain-containing protein [Candidatus Limnocylindria bacterium]
MHADQPILETGVLAELLESTGDDVEFVRELLDTYLAETPEHMAAIRQAIEADDAAALVRPAHTLKSSSATLGAMRMSAIGRELEMAGRSGSLEAEAHGMLPDAEATWDLTVAAVRGWQAEHPR